MRPMKHMTTLVLAGAVPLLLTCGGVVCAAGDS